MRPEHHQSAPPGSQVRQPQHINARPQHQQSAPPGHQCHHPQHINAPPQMSQSYDQRNQVPPAWAQWQFLQEQRYAQQEEFMRRQQEQQRQDLLF